eukprot:CAMPEP_0174261336 /NCGR_PEP_ID=MMETSP0439-20130205/11370_1 /TAXON_ID=0 /ORGANISM="Stereomyxa ramosa, Strain Chinc5" /LENGTH=204 /DNA_ID=CAMNT_0015345793 /DNA_START=27 /DNA_END=641 /DNA_ORIENTATION=-
MGNDLGIKKREVKQWKEQYKIPKDKVKLTLKAFRNQKGRDGTISREKFIEVMTEHGAADEEFANAIFESFDTDCSGAIDIEEYMALMGVTFGGSVEEKLEASFNLFDKDGNGELDETEVEEMLLMATRAVVRKQFNASKHTQTNKVATGQTQVDIPDQLKEKIKAIVATIFEKVDTDGNGSISKEEFQEGFTQHPEICAFFKQF